MTMAASFSRRWKTRRTPTFVERTPDCRPSRWGCASPRVRGSGSTFFFHQCEQIAFGVVERGEPELVIRHLRDHVRIVDE
jgi:hypothetical protein